MPDGAGHVSDELLERQRLAIERGERPSIADLLADTPFAGDPEAQLDLLYNEVVVREEQGDTVTAAEYIARFPHLQSHIELHFEIHQAIGSHLMLDTVGRQEATDAAGGESRQRAVSLPVQHYEIGELLGRGAMADVFRARHRDLNRIVALKVFRDASCLTGRHSARIRTEAEATARLSHPNIVQIYDIGECDGVPFLALELAEQGTLAQRLQRLPFSPRSAAALVVELAEAIHHAHARQVLHRDLKPANVLFSSDGSVRISDFGLAKLQTDEDAAGPDVTATGETLGTPRYMSPEQASGSGIRVGPAADIYALGTLLYECLAGRAPFVASSVPDTLRMIAYDDPLPPRRWQPGIPRDLETICLQCLRKEPERRYPTAGDLAADLRRFLQHEPIRARRTPPWERAWKWCRRRPLQAALVAWALLAGSGVLSAAIVLPHIEQRRLQALRQDVASLVARGQTALDRDEIALAETHFHAAWLKVQGEPSLADHSTSVAGWLGHARQLSSQSLWRRRIPPRDFDDKRDEALLLSAVPPPWNSEPWVASRNAVESALQLTVPDDPRWSAERAQLLMLEAVLTARTATPAAALELLDAARLPESARRHLVRAALLREAGQSVAAVDEERAADSLPRTAAADTLWSAMEQARSGQFDAAAETCSQALRLEPANFAARQLQGVCLVRLQRFAEAEIALTACLAQRPHSAWCYYYRGLSESEAGEAQRALDDLQRALESRPSSVAEFAARSQLRAMGGHETRRESTNDLRLMQTAGDTQNWSSPE